MSERLHQYDLAEPLRIVAGRTSEFGHYFGGPGQHRQIDRLDDELHLHLLYMLNTDDPLLSMLRRPQAKWLPLYHPCVYNGTHLSYQVVSETEIEILTIGEEESHPDFPYESFPRVLPHTEVSLEPISYDVHKMIALATAYHDAGMCPRLSTSDNQTLTALDWPNSFAQIGGVQWLLQGPWERPCQNSECSNSGPSKPFERHLMLLLGVIWDAPVPGISLWGEPGAQAIYEICPECLSICTWSACE
jgi:hypothetical protein